MPGDWLPYFEHDAVYRYYLHGPLARTEIGDLQVQGIDYAYTLQGWLKGVNSNTLESSRDIGQDGNSGLNANFAKDAFGFTLGYRDGDFEPIDVTNKWSTVSTRFEAVLESGDNIFDARKDLFNGNIGHMVTSLYAPPLSTGGDTTGANLTNGMAYTYDQLNRLVTADGFANLSAASNQWNSTSSYNTRYHNGFTYDGNGNILSQLRADSSNIVFDSLFYHYQLDDDGMPLRNRLYHVNDSCSCSPSLRTDDIDDMAGFVATDDLINEYNNYGYDELGQLERDSSEFIDEIFWRVDGKIKYVSREDASSKKELGFDYDAMGNRVAKHIYSSTGVWQNSSYYIRDAQGNVMSVYEHSISDSVASLTMQELHIYGSTRLGMITGKGPEMIGAVDPQDTGIFELIRGDKNYELSNHLGNVLSVVADTKMAQDSSGFVQYYNAKVLSYSDYYPFGTAISERSWSDGYRYGFNGHEKDDEVKGSGNSYDFGARMYDSRLGRWMSVDPKVCEYPWQTPFAYHRNSPIHFIDFQGEGDPEIVNGVYFVKLTNPSAKIIFNDCLNTFTGVVRGTYYDASKSVYTVNLQQYDFPFVEGNFHALFPSSGTNPSVPIGQNVQDGKVSGSETNNEKGYLAQGADGKWTSGLGNPPVESVVAFGGGIPMILDGVTYGQDTDNGKTWARGFQEQNETTVGKVIVAYNSKENSMMLVVSPDELKSGGLTLDAIRDRLAGQGYDTILAFDGGSSSTLIQDNDTVLVEPWSPKNNTIPTGLQVKGE